MKIAITRGGRTEVIEIERLAVLAGDQVCSVYGELGGSVMRVDARAPELLLKFCAQHFPGLQPVPR